MTADTRDSAGPGSRRSEAFVWLSILGLLLLWWTLPLAIGLSGWFDCGSAADPRCQAAIDRTNLARGIDAGALVAFTILCVAALVIDRRRLPRILCIVASTALVLGLVSLGIREAFSPWVPEMMWLTIPATAMLAIGSARQVRWYAARS